MESVLNGKEIQEQSYDLSCTNLENCIEEQEAFSMTTVTISRNSNTAKCTEGCLQLIIHAKKESESPSKPETITPTQKPSKSFVLKNCSSQNLVYEITPIRCNGNHVKDGNGSDVHVQAQKTITLNKNGEECSASKDDKDLINVTISGGDEKLKMFNSPLVAGTVLVKFIYEGSVTEINIPPECI